MKGHVYPGAPLTAESGFDHRVEVHLVDLEDATRVCRRGVPSAPPVGALLVPLPLLPQPRWPEGVMLPDGGLVTKDHEMDFHVPRHHQHGEWQSLSSASPAILDKNLPVHFNLC